LENANNFIVRITAPLYAEITLIEGTLEGTGWLDHTDFTWTG